MTNIKCNRCGTVNFVSDEACSVCGTELTLSIHAAEIEPDGRPRVYKDDIPAFAGPGDAIGPTIRLFKNNLWLITKIVFVIVAPFEVFRVLSTRSTQLDWQLEFGLFAMQLMCNVLVVPALFYALLSVIQTGRAPGVNEAYRWGVSKIPKLALAGLITWILTCLGLVLLIVPGIIVSLGLFLVYPVAVFEQRSAVDSLKRSWQLTKEQRWNILGASMVIGFLAGAIGLAAGGVSSLFTLNGVHVWPIDVVVQIIADIFAEAGSVLSLVIYLGILRTLESGRSVIE